MCCTSPQKPAWSRRHRVYTKSAYASPPSLGSAPLDRSLLSIPAPCPLSLISSGEARPARAHPTDHTPDQTSRLHGLRVYSSYTVLSVLLLNRTLYASRLICSPFVNALQFSEFDKSQCSIEHLQAVQSLDKAIAIYNYMHVHSLAQSRCNLSSLRASSAVQMSKSSL